VSGPYVVKRVRQCGYCNGSGSAPYVPGMEYDTCLRCEGSPELVLSMKAVADLDEALSVAEGWITTSTAVAKADASALSGLLNRLATAFVDERPVPLPDGSEIHVEKTTEQRIAVDLSAAGEVLSPEPFEARLERWNSRFGAAAQEEGESNGGV
jgi:hypothetical protein